MFLIATIVFVAYVAATSVGHEINHHINISRSDNILQNSAFSITCTNCTVAGDFSLSGGCSSGCGIFDETPDANFSTLPLNYNDAWIGVVVEDFSVHLDLDFQLTPAGPTNEITIPLIGDSGLSLDFAVEHVADISWMFNPMIYGWVNSSGPVNFTYGFDLVIPPKSAIWIPAIHLDNITTIGFAQSTLTPLNYTSSDPNAEFAFEIAFRPAFSVAGSVLNAKALQATVYTDIPKLDVAVSQVMNVTRDCRAAPVGTPEDRIFHNLTNVVPTVSFDWGWNGTDLGDHEYILGDQTSLPTSCLDYLPKSTALGSVPEKSSASILHRSVAATCGCALIMIWIAAWQLL